MGKSLGLRLQASIVQDNVPVEVAPGLFIGSIHAAFNVDALREKRISHVLNLAAAAATFPDDFTYLSVGIRDKDAANLLSCLPVAMLFVQAGIDAGGVLVHCAGGRSRSPAVAIAYLMTRDQLSFDAAADHVKALRPVVALNAGFESQLRCLERAKGDVFSAHQLHLQSKLSRLLQHRLDGSLEGAKRRQSRHQHQQQHTSAPRTPPHPVLNIRAQQRERRASCCDDRGMLDGSVPSGFCLSLPVAAKKKAKKTQFIPALRSMGSMFGCRACGEHLFCASAVVQHSATSKDLSRSSSAGSLRSPTSRGRHGSDDAFPFEEPIAGDRESSASSAPGAESGATSQPPPPPPHEQEATKARQPLLAKLRLRPQSPSIVSSPTGSDKSTPRSTTSSSGSISAPVAAQQPTTDAVAGKPEPPAGLRDEVGPRLCGGGVLKSLKKEKAAPHDSRVEKDDGGAGRSAGGVGSVHGPVGSKSGGSDKFWRSLTAFAATKRIFKDSKEKKPTPLASSPGAADDKKRVKTSADADGKREAASEPPLFLRENAAAWERSLRAIEKAIGRADDESAVLAEIAALIAADAKVLSMLSCDEWFIEPQEWFLDGLIQSPSGAIRCPNDGCGAVVGQWRWDGLSCSCGGLVRPGIQMKRNAIQPLGNILTQLCKSPNDSGPAQPDALRHRLK
ncbi:hypothetical protein PybrP1_003517 [[Pythium] brassicae (nom. inval.)]|nr:hypothetical protein PybrP1_003517 [[Pythium] brassicae (nom. inval.)]